MPCHSLCPTASTTPVPSRACSTTMKCSMTQKSFESKSSYFLSLPTLEWPFSSLLLASSKAYRLFLALASNLVSHLPLISNLLLFSTFRFSNLVHLEWDPEFAISNRFPGDTNAAGLEIILWKPLEQWSQLAVGIKYNISWSTPASWIRILREVRWAGSFNLKVP